jgi:DNA (cytosine-5)-methyltransferase 1
MPTYLDLFAGPGGWDEGIRDLGICPLGIEWDAAACATARAAGHRRLQADVAALDPAEFGPVRGLIASPPCQGFSMAGKGRGREDSEHLVKAVRDLTGAWGQLEDAMASLHATMADDRSLLALEPLRWCLELQPEWTAWEQVPTVLPLWEACAQVLRRCGYSVATGILRTEQYGVPQTRRRAILVARSPELTDQLGPAELPTPTHSRYHERDRGRLDDGVQPWVSMADALGWGATGRPGMTVTGGGTATGGAEPFGNAARQGLWREAGAGRWVQRSNYAGPPTAEKVTAEERGRSCRSAQEPSLAITSKGFTWLATGTRPNAPLRSVSDPAPTLAPGHDAASHVWLPNVIPAGDVVAAKLDGRAVRVSVAEAAVLQSFPPDYPFTGMKGARYRQVGDAVPPLLARAVVAAVAGCATAAEDVA